jgi:hypothetical protein
VLCVALGRCSQTVTTCEEGYARKSPDAVTAPQYHTDWTRYFAATADY